MELSIQNHSDDNWPLLRYADVLMYAEALNELNPTPTDEPSTVLTRFVAAPSP